MLQRLRSLDLLESRGSMFNLFRAAVRSSSLRDISIIFTLSARRFAAYFLTRRLRLISRLTIEVFAIFSICSYVRNGNLNAANNARASSSERAVVVMVMSMPRNVSILS